MTFELASICLRSDAHPCLPGPVAIPANAAVVGRFLALALVGFV